MSFDSGTQYQRIFGVDEIEEALRSRISREGAIPFHTFMDIALYSPQYGYYARRGPGRDYKTAPRISPAFGHLLAAAFERFHEFLGRPDTLDITEVGAGSGELARAISGYLEGKQLALASAIRYLAIDHRPPTDFVHPRLQWRPATSQMPDSHRSEQRDGIVFSNELYDAFPVHRIVGTWEDPAEIWVSMDDGRLKTTIGPLSDRRPLDILKAAGIQLEVGQIADIAIGAPEHYRSMCKSIARGIVLTIDYGGEATDIYSSHRRAGTLISYFHHHSGDSPLDRPGDQDLTAHVDFTALRLAGEEEGLVTVLDCDQRTFLIGLGLEAWTKSLDQVQLTVADRFNALAGASELVRLDGLGRFRVLVQSRDVEPEAIRTIFGA